MRNSHGRPASRRWPAKPSASCRRFSDAARKLRDSGRMRQNTTAATSAMPPSAASAACQETKSTSTPLISRPLIPPMALPPMYSPMDRPMCCGWISSLR
ncbi:hypothetical protein D3C78_1301200 [compost metagenome]